MVKIKKPRVTVGKPRVTVNPPQITVGTPRVTVGGDVGKVGDRIIKGATRVIEDFSKAAVNPAVQTIQIIGGKPIDDAIKDCLKSYVSVAGSAVELSADIVAIKRQLTTDLAAKIGGKTAENLLADVFRATDLLPIDYVAATLRAIEEFIETGKLDALNPLAILIAAEIVHARNLLWGRAREISTSVVGALPAELQGRAGVCRVLPVSQVPGNFNLPKIAIAHLQKATAVCLVDVIVFDTIPGVSTDQELHYWCHELHHAQQYAGWGIAEFVTRYVKHSIKGGLNPIEEDADLYACHFFPGATPAYIGACPV